MVTKQVMLMHSIISDIVILSCEQSYHGTQLCFLSDFSFRKYYQSRRQCSTQLAGQEI